MNAFRSLLAGALAALCLIAALPVAAQDEAADEQDRPVFRITPQPDDRVASGKAMFLQGKTDALGVRFVVDELDVMQPVTVALYTQSVEDDVRLQIVKDGSWEHPVREARTGSERIAEFDFRTFDSFNIRVDADNPTDYQLAVWVGDALPEEPPAIAVPASEYREPADSARGENAADGRRGGAISLSYLEIGLIVALLVVIGAFLLRRKSS